MCKDHKKVKPRSGKHHWNKTPLLIYTLAGCLLLQHQLAGAVLTSALLVWQAPSKLQWCRLPHLSTGRDTYRHVKSISNLP